MRIFLHIAVYLLLAACACAQAAPGAQEAPGSEAAPSFFPTNEGPFYFAGQINYIYQEHGQFSAAYSGPNSLVNTPEDALSRVLTFYTGLQLNSSSEILFDLEETGGQGLSTVLGLAGFTNLDAVRNPELSTAPYVARLMFHQVFSLGGGTVAASSGPLSTFRELPARRLELRVGKFSLADFFDVNSVGSDSHLQFMNWTIDNNGAWDYAANTRGYTYAAMVELQSPAWGARFAEALMPKVANGINLQWDLRQAHSENLELEYRPQGQGFWARHPATIRLLGYGNTANMGVYRDAIDNFLDGQTPVPEITDHPPEPRRKLGAGLNFEQQVRAGFHVFGRVGVANGRYESFAYTEVEQTVSGGATWAGASWRRPDDKIGLATVVNGISGDHRRYLELGGDGFLLGDGGLTYGHERTVEGFYNIAVGRGVYLAPDVQYIVNPGYNQVRGPVWVSSARFHVDF